MKFALIALAIFTPSLAHATDINIVEKNWNACLESEEGQSTHGMLRCNHAAYEAADAELNSVYKSIMKEYEGGDKDSAEIRNRLRNAQRAWIGFRDSDCLLTGVEMLGGTGENVLISSCTASTTIQRVKDLKELFASH